MSKKNIIITSVIAIILAIIIIPSAIYCIVNKETPVQMVTDTFSSNEDQIVGKWQHESKATAYEFKADGTCISYISILKTTCQYEIDGNKLYMTNPSIDGQRDTYKISVKESKLTLTLIETNGVPVNKEDQEEWTYKKVSKITTQRLDDLLYSAVEGENE